MALRKIKELNSGVSGDYWKIIYESYDRLSRVMEARIALFRDRDASIGGLMHLGLVKVFIFPMTYAESQNSRTTLCYTRIKAMANKEVHGFRGNVENSVYDPDLAGSTDV